MKWPAFILLLTFNSVAYADTVQNIAQLTRLPAYCRGTQLIREISQDPTPFEVYVAKYGPGFKHLHHYCWALTTEHRVARENPKDGKFWLQQAIVDIDYVIRENRDPNFFFLPEIYTSKARIIFKLDQPSDAVQWLQKAIEIRSDYVPAYARLSDYYADQGNNAQAIKILKQGIARSKRSQMLQRRLNELESKN